MSETRARDVSRTFGQAIEQNTITATGSLGVAGLSVYATIDDLPLSGINAGTQALVTSTNTLYINNGVGWFKIALINTNPYFTDSGTPESTYALSSQGTTTTITLIAVDSEGIPIIYSAVADSDFGGLASISQDSSVFTITPFSEDSATTSSGTVTFKATDGVNIASALSTFTLQFAITNSSHTLLLAKASGNDGTNAITDESSNGYTLTKGGDVKRSAFSPYRNAGYSYYFDGSGDYIAMPSNSTDVQLGSGDFTVEAWIYPTASGGEIINKWQGTTSNSSWRFWISANNALEFDYRSNNGSTYVNAIAAADNSIRLNEWQHVATTRNGSTWRLFNNGIKIAEATDSGTINNGSYPVWIGRLTDSYGNDTAFTGYIADARIIKGTAIYTADFTAPTERLTAVSGTSLLTCHLPYLADGSSSDYSLTANGNVKAEPFTPFDNNAAYSASNNGSSLYLDGNGDYLTVADTAARLGGSASDSWTIECWVYLEGLPSTRAKHAPLWVQYSVSASNRSQLYINQQANKLLFWVAADGTTQHETALSTHKWYHIAMVKSGNSVTLYLNGKGETDSIVYDAGLYQENPTIGAVTENGDYLEGYIADYVMTKGTAKYSADFTPPTAPISNSSSTVAIANVSTPNLYSASQNRNSHALYGNVKSSTGQTKYASSSIYFDGTGDYIINNTSVDTLTTTTQPFTVEAWVYPTTNTGDPKIVSFNRASDGANTMLFSHYDVYVTDTSYTYNTVASLNEWSHVATTYNGKGKWNAFVNGNIVMGTNKTISAAPSECYVGIGVDFDAANGGSPGNYFQGYMQDVRISNIIRYPFIPAKETITASANTQFLTAHASSITDGSGNSHSITTGGNAAVSSTIVPASGMYSVSFDGSGDYLRADTAVDFATSTSSTWTIEGWVFFNDINSSSLESIFGLNKASDGANVLLFGTENSKWHLNLNAIGVGSSDFTGFVAKQWYHWAVTCDGSANIHVFIDGCKLYDSGGTVPNTALANCVFFLGAEADAADGGTLGNYLNGYLSNVVVTSGIKYPDSFTPPTAELQG